MNTVAFRLDITPRGQGRARAFAFNGHARVHKAKDDEVHEAKIAALAKAHRRGRVFDIVRDELANARLSDG